MKPWIYAIRLSVLPCSSRAWRHSADRQRLCSSSCASTPCAGHSPARHPNRRLQPWRPVSDFRILETSRPSINASLMSCRPPRSPWGAAELWLCLSGSQLTLLRLSSLSAFGPKQTLWLAQLTSASDPSRTWRALRLVGDRLNSRGDRFLQERHGCY
jgi:hypothetical protein